MSMIGKIMESIKENIKHSSNGPNNKEKKRKDNDMERIMISK